MQKFNSLIPWDKVASEFPNTDPSFLCVLTWPAESDEPSPPDPPHPPDPPDDPTFTFGVNDNFQLTASTDEPNITFETPANLDDPNYGKLIIRSSDLQWLKT